jgi:hypothetical protein
MGFAPSWFRESVRLDLLPTLEWQWILLSFRWLQKEREWPLSDLLCHSCCYPSARSEPLLLHATENRDYVYGLTGLAPTAMKEIGMEIDYTMSWQEVFIDTTYRILQSGDFTLFSLCLGEPSEVPSWVPLFHIKVKQPNMRSKFIQNDRILGNALFSASGSTSVECQLVKNSDETSPSLKVKGTIVDVISEMKPKHPRHDSDPSVNGSVPDNLLVLYGTFFTQLKDFMSGIA